jgi:hypothetical protein
MPVGFLAGIVTSLIFPEPAADAGFEAMQRQASFGDRPAG